MSQRLLETDFPSGGQNHHHYQRHHHHKPAVQIRRSVASTTTPTREQSRPPNLVLARPLSTSGAGTMPKSYATSASEWQYEPSLITSSNRTGSMSRVQTSFAVKQQPQQIEAVVTRTGSLRKAFMTSTTSDEEDELMEETRPLHRPQHHPSHPKQPSTNNSTVTSSVEVKSRPHGGVTTTTTGNNSQSSTSDYHSDENPNLLPVEHRELPSFRLQQFNRHRKSEDDEMTGGARCCFGFLVLIAQILLHGVLGLVWFWIVHYHSDEKATWGAFAWRDNPELEFNLHPVLMITGFIYFSGQSMLMYRTCRCCRRIWSKLLHTLFHLLATPCIAFAFIAVWDSHAYRKPEPIPHFYSLHSWMGATTMGLFALQFVVGFFSFILLLCCESATASFRAALVPIHSTFGITTFVMAVATACAGLTEKAFFTLRDKIKSDPSSIKEPDEYDYSEDIYYKAIGDLYTELPNEAIIINTLAAALVALAILLPCILKCDTFHKGLEPEAEVESDVE